MTVTPGRGLTWAALSFTLFIAALLAIFPILAALRLFGEIPHLAQMALWSLSWGVLSVLGVLVAAQLVFGAWLRPRPLGVGIAAVGIGLSAVLNVVLQQWQISSIGFVDPDYLGVTAGLFAVLIGLAVAGFAAFLVPKQLIGWPLAAVMLGSLGVAVIVLSNAPALQDGIGPNGWALAICVGLSGVYALITGGLVVRRALDRTEDALGV
jgi:hypothetical protein